MEIYKEFDFEAAHFLPNVPEGHKCKNIHGHSYRFTIFLKGDVNAETGWIMDFAILKSIVNPIVKQLDHQTLNNIMGLENPTVENLSIWLWDTLKPQLPLLSRIIVKETASSGCVYEGI
ncbi:MAG: 6-carboxytetrahydropterin synthase QueD [Bacteroidia bacterium]|nr:6-carboxytetrahydropterin synthase QueD [Bacteroidia bacterium]